MQHTMRIYGLSPRQVSQTIGKSDRSQPSVSGSPVDILCNKYKCVVADRSSFKDEIKKRHPQKKRKFREKDCDELLAFTSSTPRLITGN
jgi:hypothetical protein